MLRAPRLEIQIRSLHQMKNLIEIRAVAECYNLQFLCIMLLTIMTGSLPAVDEEEVESSVPRLTVQDGAIGGYAVRSFGGRLSCSSDSMDALLEKYGLTGLLVALEDTSRMVPEDDLRVCDVAYMVFGTRKQWVESYRSRDSLEQRDAKVQKLLMIIRDIQSLR